MRKSEYQRIIDRVLIPKLVRLGFEKVNLKDCITPEVLYRNKDLWFSTSWDWRDRYLEIDLGHLHWFKDVMPWFIVLGDYSSYCDEINKLKKSDEDYLENVAKTIANTIEAAIKYNKKNEHNVVSYLLKRNKYSTVFKKHLGNEVRDEELSKYKA